MKSPNYINTVFSSPAAISIPGISHLFNLATIEAISDIIDRMNRPAMALFDIKKRQQRQL